MNGIFPTERYITFFGNISSPSTNNLRAALCTMVNEGAQKITILFASPGGLTDDGIALYTYLTALPVDLTMHAVGIVGSIAIPIFLAAPNRFASRNARFFFHEYSWTHTQANIVTKTTMDEQSLRISDCISWTKDIIKTTTKITDKDFETMKLFDYPFNMDPASASKTGLISAVAEPRIPAGSQPRVVI